MGKLLALGDLWQVNINSRRRCPTTRGEIVRPVLVCLPLRLGETRTEPHGGEEEPRDSERTDANRERPREIPSWSPRCRRQQPLPTMALTLGFLLDVSGPLTTDCPYQWLYADFFTGCPYPYHFKVREF